MNTCKTKLHIDMPLFFGSMCIRFKNYLYETYLYGIYPKQNINDTLMSVLDAAYIQPIFYIFKNHIQDKTGHKVSISGNGQRTQITYDDTGAIFQFEILEYGDTDVDLLYNDMATEDEALYLIRVIETIYATHPQFNISEAAEELNRQTQQWLDEIKENTKCLNDEDDDYDEEEEEALWDEYLSEIQEGFDEWKARKKANKEKPDGPDLAAGTIMFYDGENWKELQGVSNVQLTVDTDDCTSFYADDTIFYNSEPIYEFSFNVSQVSDSFKELAEAVGVSIKKSQNSSAPP